MEQTDRFRGEAGGEDWKRSAKEHTCMYAEPTDTDNNVMRAGSWGDMGWVERGKGWGKWETSVIVSTVKKVVSSVVYLH